MDPMYPSSRSRRRHYFDFSDRFSASGRWIHWIHVHVSTNGVALCEVARRNFEWHSVHRNSVALCEMAERNVEWYSVHKNRVALREMAQRNAEWYSVHKMV